VSPRRSVLRVATLNAWSVPLASRDVERRMGRVGARLPDLDVDLVAFQEVWTDAAREILVAAGRAAGLDRAWHNPGTLGGSGLLVLSRRPFWGARFERFWLRGLPLRLQHGDYWGGKGFVRLRLETEAGPVVILDTHLHARYGPDHAREYRGVRTGQAVQLAAALREDGEPVIALGDFNVREGSPEHAVLMGLAGWTDAAAALGRRQDTVLEPHPYRGAGHEGSERIDYVFCRPGRRATARPRAIRRILDEPIEIDGREAAYSDHAGLRAEVEIARAGPAPLPPPDPDALERARGLLAQGQEQARRRRRMERSTAFGAAAVAVGSLPGAAQLQLARRSVLSGLAAGVGLAAVPGATLAAWLSESVAARELEAYRRLDLELTRLEPVAAEPDGLAGASSGGESG
jgi:endonuclease/exonuclease/phosphatase family metal-dependent hydrolase